MMDEGDSHFLLKWVQIETLSTVVVCNMYLHACVLHRCCEKISLVLFRIHISSENRRIGEWVCSDWAGRNGFFVTRL